MVWLGGNEGCWWGGSDELPIVCPIVLPIATPAEPPIGDILQSRGEKYVEN